MNAVGVRVKIFDGEKCVYQHKTDRSSEDVNFKTLLRDLRDVQTGVNDFLTTLVQRAAGNARDAAERSTLDVESDFIEEGDDDDDDEQEDETQVNPKKYKLSIEDMSTALSNEAQLRYMIEWFQEWSEMQRNDFLGVLLENCGPVGLVNGLVVGMENLGCEGSNRPPSLFQCRVKLFREWSGNWSQREKESLLAAIKNTDSKFSEKYEERLSALMEDKRQ